MTQEIQTFLTILICLLSVLYLGVRFFKKRKVKSGCANCPALKLNHKK